MVFTATNISEDASSPNAAFRNLAVLFVNEAGNDFHLDSSDTAAKGAGTNLSADAQYPFSTDIDGETITTWSIGADAASGGTISPAAGTSAGSSTAQASGVAEISAAATAAGISTATAVGQSTSAGSATSAGSSTAVARSEFVQLDRYINLVGSVPVAIISLTGIKPTANFAAIGLQQINLIGQRVESIINLEGES